MISLLALVYSDQTSASYYPMISSRLFVDFLPARRQLPFGRFYGMNLSRREILLLLGIFLLGLIPRLWRLPYDLQVHRDQGMHAQAIWNIWYEGRISLLGHSTDADGIWHGPLFYWLMTPSFFPLASGPATFWPQNCFSLQPPLFNLLRPV